MGELIVGDVTLRTMNIVGTHHMTSMNSNYMYMYGNKM